MQTVAWVIAGSLALLLGLVLWDRARRAAMLGAAIAEREGARGERDRLRAELDSAVVQFEAARAQVQEATVLAAELREQLKHAGERERATRESHERQLSELKDSHERVLKERDAAALTLRAEAKSAQEKAQEEFERRLAAVQAQIRGSIEEAAKLALDGNRRSFLELATAHLDQRAAEATGELEKRRVAVEGLVKPLGEAVEKTRELLSKSDEQRAAELARLGAEVAQTHRLNAELKQETAKLARAMSRPEVRGRYGELQLQRVLELSGMREHIDFSQQASSRDDEGALQRPDVIVNLPNDRRIVIDAKTNLDAFVRAAGAENEPERERLLEKFADDVLSEARRLSSRRYADSIGAFDFVVMFVPGDQLIDAAFQRHPDLLEQTAQCNVIIASPSTLIGLLRAVHAGWRERRVAENAQQMLTLGRELHERSARLLTLVHDLGESITDAGKKYDKVAASLDSRFMPTLRRFEELGARAADAIKDVPAIEVTVRPLASLPAGGEIGGRPGA